MKPKTRFRGMTLFVTVGSTKFDGLIGTVLSNEFVKQLMNLGFSRLIIQAGKSLFDSEQINLLKREHKIDIELYDYKQSIQDDIERADIVIGHAGAGTCLEVLRKNKRLLLVTNDSLMDNHQSELADELAKQGYVLRSTIDELTEKLDKICDSETKFSVFPAKDESKFEEIFNEALRKVTSHL